jgi:hypothetical protein
MVMLNGLSSFADHGDLLRCQALTFFVDVSHRERDIPE